jgi:hypothetical protein
MDEKINDIDHTSNAEEKNSNVELIYSYTESLIKAQEESLNRLDTKLSAFLAFAGVALRFAIDLPNKSTLTQTPELVTIISLLLKLSACGLSVASILVSAWGLTARMRGSVVSPETLMSDKWYWEEAQRCRAFIINTWIRTEREYKKIGSRKGKNLNLAIKIICGSAIAFALDIVLLSFYK